MKYLPHKQEDLSEGPGLPGKGWVLSHMSVTLRGLVGVGEGRSLEHAGQGNQSVSTGLRERPC